ncbi:MAG: anti-sigma factor antagonist [Lachnospiraceae bacterium]|nr:anti-sigma factor antagonist [Lachnospiraceae bacterium]
MGNNFKVTGTSLTIYLPAEVDHHNAEALKNDADRLIQNQNIRCIIFDFAQTNFMDSSGIGMIMGRYKNLRFMGGNVIAIRVNERIRRILTMSGIYKVIDIYEDIPQQSKLL